MVKGEPVAEWKGKEYSPLGFLWLLFQLVSLFPAILSPITALLIAAMLYSDDSNAATLLLVSLLLFLLLTFVISFVVTRFYWRWRLALLAVTIFIIPTALILKQCNVDARASVPFEGHEQEYEEVVRLILAASLPSSERPIPSDSTRFVVTTSYRSNVEATEIAPEIHYILNVTPFGDTTLDFSSQRRLRDPGLWRKKAKVQDTLIAKAIVVLKTMRIRMVYVQGNWIQFVNRDDYHGMRGYLYMRNKELEQPLSAANSGGLRRLGRSWYEFTVH